MKGLSDIGSSGGFITHEEANRCNFTKLRATNLTVNKLAGEAREKTFIHLVVLWNWTDKNYDQKYAISSEEDSIPIQHGVRRH